MKKSYEFLHIHTSYHIYPVYIRNEHIFEFGGSELVTLEFVFPRGCDYSEL